ncbi:ribonuclease H-like domain-containing protein [Tanacetum coccineum]
MHRCFFILHDDEELSLHDDASLAGSVPASNKGDAPAIPPQIITTNILSNIKLPVLQKDDYDTWAMEMEHYLEYIDNELEKVMIQNGELKEASSHESSSQRRFSFGMDDAKEIGQPSRQRCGGNGNSKKNAKEAVVFSALAFGETGYGYHDIPLYSRFKQVEYKGVPHPLSGDYTPREQEDIDDSLYEYGKYGPQPQTPSPTVSNASSIVFSTCQSNDSDGEQRTISENSANNDSIPIPSSEQVSISTQKTQSQVPTSPQTVDPSCAQHVKTPRQPIRTPVTPSPISSYNRQNWNQRIERELGAGYSFSGNSRFNTGKQHVSSGCVFNTGKQHVSSVRVNRPVSNNTSPKPSQVNLNSPKKCFSKQRSPVNRPFSRYTAYKSNKYAVKGKMGTAVKTSAGCVWRKAIPLSNTNSGPTPDSNVYVSRGPQGRPKPVKAWVTRINWRILKNSIGDLLPLEVLCTNTTNGYQFTMSNQHKDWLVQEQTALGAKGLTSPEQTATGKGISNPLMAVMVCQKPYGIQLTNVSRVNTPGSDENRLKLYDLMYKIVKVADARRSYKTFKLIVDPDDKDLQKGKIDLVWKSESELGNFKEVRHQSVRMESTEWAVSEKIILDRFQGIEGFPVRSGASIKGQDIRSLFLPAQCGQSIHSTMSNDEMDINWQIAMTAIKIKKFYKKTGRRPRVDGKMHVAFDKRKVECFNCHNTGHFARECKFKSSKDGSRQEAGRNQDFKPVRTEKEALMTIDEGQINWVEQTEDEELNHALMAFTEAALTAHKLAVKKLESQLRASHKQQSSLTEKLNFQANQIFEKDEKLKKYRRIGMKAIGFRLRGIKSNAEVLGYEEEISRGIFALRKTDAGYHNIPLYSRFKQVEYKGIPHPLSGDYTPREQEDIDDSLYEYGKYGPQPQSPSPTESDASSTVYSTCQSNDSDGEARKTGGKKGKSIHSKTLTTISNIRPNLILANKTIKTGRVNVNPGHGNVSSGSVSQGRPKPVHARVPKEKQISLFHVREHPLKKHGSNKSNIFIVDAAGAHDSLTRSTGGFMKNSIGDLLPLESSGDKDSLGDDASKQGRIDIGDIKTDAEIKLIIKKLLMKKLDDENPSDENQFLGEDLVFEALDKRQIGEDAIISPIDNSPYPHNLCNLVVTKLDSTEKLVKESGELRAISGYVLGASGVQIPQNNLDNLRSIEEEDGATEVLDPRDIPGSVLLEIIDFTILGLLLEPLVLDGSTTQFDLFMDDFSVFGDSFDKCLNNLDKILQRCKDAHLVLNWEKYHFIVKEGIVLGHKVFGT